jgi:small subunit ribosomal protein S2
MASTPVNLPSMEKLLEAGAHFGHQVTRWNPKMKKFIYTRKDNVHIIDLNQTLEQLKITLAFVQDIVSDNKKILFVGTKKQATQIVKQYATECNMPYVINRWIGGLLTNYDIVSRNIKKLNQLKKDLENPEFIKKYTKREINLFKQEYSELNKIYAGVKDLSNLPAALFIVDAHHEKTVVLEARRKKIPVIAIIDTNANPDLIDFPIPANDDSYKSLELIISTLAQAFPKNN